MQEILKMDSVEVNVLGSYTTLNGEKCKNTTTPLHVALSNREYDVARKLFTDPRVDLNAPVCSIRISDPIGTYNKLGTSRSKYTRETQYF